MKMSNSIIDTMTSERKPNGLDGPYARYKGDQVEILCTNEAGDILTQFVNPGEPIMCKVDNETKDSFFITLRDPSVNEQLKSVYPVSNSIIIIADIEGNFNAFYSLLVSHAIMNTNFEWTFGGNDLVILGDAMDKGQNVTQCLWLTYHLEQQAEQQGGKVHYLLGNHELMNFHLDIRYVPDKYLALARKLSGSERVIEAYRLLLARNKILTDWWMSKNCIERIGNTLFVHGGISPQFVERGLSIEQTNIILHKYLKKEFVPRSFSDAVVGTYGPLWYRGLVCEDTRNGVYQKVDESFVDTILECYGAKRIVIGHTVVEHVSSDFHNKVWRTDVLHGASKFSSKSEGLLIEDDNLFLLDGAGAQLPLQGSETTSEWHGQTGTPVTFLQ